MYSIHPTLENVNEDGRNSSDSNYEICKSNNNSEEETSENANNRKRKIEHNKRAINKKRRMTGQQYLGFRKPRHQKNTFHETNRNERKMKKKRCTCNSTAKNPTKHCFKVSEEDRNRIFAKFSS